MEKASFNWLNRLFEIAGSERNYQTFLSSRNHLTVSWEPQPYTLNILPRWLPKKVVPGEHFVLKDLLFYATTCEVDTKACQERIRHQEERRQEGTLWRASSEKRRAPSPLTRPPVEKKRILTKEIVIRSPAPSPSSTSTLPAPDSPAPASDDVSSSSERDLCDSKFGPFAPESEHSTLPVIEKPAMEKSGPSRSEPEPLALMIIEKPTAEKLGPSRSKPESLAIAVMDNPAVARPSVPHDLRADFGERHHKCLYEAIKLGSSTVQGD